MQHEKKAIILQGSHYKSFKLDAEEDLVRLSRFSLQFRCIFMHLEKVLCAAAVWTPQVVSMSHPLFHKRRKSCFCIQTSLQRVLDSLSSLFLFVMFVTKTERAAGVRRESGMGTTSCR